MFDYKSLIFRCGDPVQRIEQSPLGKIFVCTFGGAKHTPDGCRRTYLSQRDLQAHINHRHNRPLQQQQQQQAQQQAGAAPPVPPSSVQDQQMRTQGSSRMPDASADHIRTSQGYEPFTGGPPPSSAPPPTQQMHNPYGEEEPDNMPNSPNAQDEYGMGRIQVRKSNLITVPLQDNSVPQQHPPPPLPQHPPQHPPPTHHAPPPPRQQHPPQHPPPPASVYQSGMPPHSSVPPPPPQHGYPQHAPLPMGHSTPVSYANVPPPMVPQNPHYSMAPPPPVPPVSHIGPPSQRYDSGPPHPPFSGPTGPMASQSPPFQSVSSTGAPPQWMGQPPPRIIMTQAPSMPSPGQAPGMARPPRPDMVPPPPRSDGRYRPQYFSQ